MRISSLYMNSVFLSGTVITEPKFKKNKDNTMICGFILSVGADNFRVICDDTYINNIHKFDTIMIDGYLKNSYYISDKLGAYKITEIMANSIAHI